jgi:hypothetical protein
VWVYAISPVAGNKNTQNERKSPIAMWKSATHFSFSKISMCVLGHVLFFNGRSSASPPSPLPQYFFFSTGRQKIRDKY